MIGTVYSARVKSDFIVLLPSLLKVGSQEQREQMVTLAVEAGCLQLDPVFITQNQKLAQKGLQFLTPYFIVFILVWC